MVVIGRERLEEVFVEPAGLAPGVGGGGIRMASKSAMFGFRGEVDFGAEDLWMLLGSGNAGGVSSSTSSVTISGGGRA